MDVGIVGSQVKGWDRWRERSGMWESKGMEVASVQKRVYHL